MEKNIVDDTVDDTLESYDIEREKELTNNMETNIVKTNQVDGFIEKAIATNAPVETLERLFTLHKGVKAEQAKEEFVQALATFQGDVPVITKNKKVMNKDGRTVRYMYAPMDSVVEQIKKPLSENNLSYNWQVERKEKHMAVTCKLTHTAGHNEISTFEIPIVESQYMSSPQSYATAQSYAKRYTLLNVLGIGTADEDTDATDTGNDKDAKSMKARIIFLLRQLGEKTDTKKEIEESVKKQTKMTLDNLEKVKNALEILVDEKQSKELNK